VVWIEDGISRMEGNSKEVVDAYESYMVERVQEHK